MPSTITLNGPDFLELLSSNAMNNGWELDYHELAKRAREWRGDQEAAHVARDANDLLSRELVNLRRQAADACDALSRVRPHSENLDDYTVAREALIAIAALPQGAPAWISTAGTTRDPRLQPMPGDRFYLPVEVTFANYGPASDIATTLSPLIDGQPMEQKFHVYAVQSAWLQGAIGIAAQLIPTAIAA